MKNSTRLTDRATSRRLRWWQVLSLAVLFSFGAGAAEITQAATISVDTTAQSPGISGEFRYRCRRLRWGERCGRHCFRGFDVQVNVSG